MMLIPFAIIPSTGEYVDVYKVKQGRECGCVCPSCGQGVLARHGDVKEWHFAHYDSSPIKPSKLPCDISFYGTLKAYILELTCKSPPKVLRIPHYEVTEKRHSFSTKGLTECVTRENTYEIECFDRHSQFDLVTKIKKVNLYLHCTYPGRKPPKVNNCESGILLLDLEHIRTVYSDFDRHNQTIKGIVTEFLESTVQGKHWLFHRREKKIRQRLQERLKTEWPEFDNIREELFGSK